MHVLLAKDDTDDPELLIENFSIIEADGSS
jgi:hypothetical protein